IPYLRGTREGLTAVARYVRWMERPRLHARAAANEPARLATAGALQRLLARGVPAEHEARAIMARYGVHGPEECFVSSAEEAARAATGIGFPVVLKGIVPGMLHKSDAGMVKLRLADAGAVRAAAGEMLARAARDGHRASG